MIPVIKNQPCTSWAKYAWTKTPMISLLSMLSFVKITYYLWVMMRALGFREAAKKPKSQAV
jgi:hypothetical protein